MANSSFTVGELQRIGTGHLQVQVDLVSDDSDGSVPDALVSDGNLIGCHLEGIEAVPGSGDAAPSGVFTVAIKNSRGRAILTATDNPADDIGFAQPDHDVVINTPLTITCTDIGNSNELSLILMFDINHYN